MSRLTLEASRTDGNAGSTVALPKKLPAWAKGSRDPACAIVAERLGLTPQYAEKLLRLGPKVLVAVILELRKVGNEKRIAALTEAIDRAKEGREPPPDCEGTWSAADAADGKEDVRQGAYQRHPTLQTRAAYIEALREDRRSITSIIDLLVDEQEREQCAQERQS